MASKRTGREQQRATATAQARTPNLGRFYRYRAPAITPGDFAFHLDLLRPGLAPLSIDRMVDTLTWNDEAAGLNGSVTAYRPELTDPRSLPVTRGHLVRCRVVWGGGTYQLWTMRVGAPQIEVDTGNVSIPLTDDMALLDTGTRDWWFRATKHRPFGYRADEIAGVVAKTLGVRLRKAARGTTRFDLKMKRASGLAVLRAAYLKERDHAGRAFVIRMRDGEVEITPLARNPIIYLLGPQIQTALLTQKGGQKVPTTVLTGRGRVGQGKHTQAVTYTEHDRAVVRLLGYVHDVKDFGRVQSHADLRGQVQRELAKRLRLADSITITHQGVPFIARGDGIELELRQEGYRAADSFIWCTRAVHTVQAGVYQTTWDFNATDPYLPAQNAAAAAKQKAAARQRKRLVRSRPKLSHA